MTMFSTRPTTTAISTTAATTTTTTNNNNNNNNNNTSSTMDKAQRQVAARRAAAKSKSKLWGPSHSFDSDDTSLSRVKGNPGALYDMHALSEQFGRVVCHPGSTSDENLNTNSIAGPGVSWWDQVVTKAWTDLNTHSNSVFSSTKHWTLPTKPPRPTTAGSSTPMTTVKEEGEADHSTEPSTQEEEDEQQTHSHSQSKSRQTQPNSTVRTGSTTRTRTSTSTTKPQQHQQYDHDPVDDEDHVSFARHTPPSKPLQSRVDDWTDMFQNACSPCSAQDLEDLFALNSTTGNSTSGKRRNKSGDSPSLMGIAPMELELDEEEEPTGTGDSGSGTATNSRAHSRGASNTTMSNSRAARSTVTPSHYNNSNTDYGGALSTVSQETPADRRRQRAAKRRQRHEEASSVCSSSVMPYDEVEVTSQQDVLIQQSGKVATKEHLDLVEEGESPASSPQQSAPLPLTTLLVKSDEAQALERSISELTMRSSYQEAISKLAETRRMAYYAVGRHHRSSGRGGNRRCYFSGKLIFGGNPFYAGSVQQGLRTLVVFCLPSALGMPSDDERTKAPRRTAWYNNPHSVAPSIAERSHVTTSLRGGLLQRSRRNVMTSDSLSRTPSKLSSLCPDDLSLSVEGDLDANWNIDKDWLLKQLPEPSTSLLDNMARRYPEQFETLPVQVRHFSCWRLYIKFCFFSGLPIAEGELHYKVRDAIAYEYGEEIVLSHDVMEAVNGTSSADILKLPNLKTFKYLKKHYQQQSAKLPDVVFLRTSWEQVKAEV